MRVWRCGSTTSSGPTTPTPPDDPSLWEIDRFVDEVVQVRVALGFDRDNFVLAGHYWGGILAIEYALRHPDQLKALVVSNMMSSSPAYNRYVADVLLPAMEPEAQARMADFMDGDRVVGPLYDELMIANLYTRHVLRRPLRGRVADRRPVGLGQRQRVRVPEAGGPHPARLLGCPCLLGTGATTWPRSRAALVIGATHDTQDPAHLEWMADRLPNGNYLHCPRRVALRAPRRPRCLPRGLVGVPARRG